MESNSDTNDNNNSINDDDEMANLDADEHRQRRAEEGMPSQLHMLSGNQAAVVASMRQGTLFHRQQLGHSSSSGFSGLSAHGASGGHSWGGRSQYKEPMLGIRYNQSSLQQPPHRGEGELPPAFDWNPAVQGLEWPQYHGPGSMHPHLSSSSSNSSTNYGLQQEEEQRRQEQEQERERERERGRVFQDPLQGFDYGMGGSANAALPGVSRKRNYRGESTQPQQTGAAAEMNRLQAGGLREAGMPPSQFMHSRGRAVSFEGESFVWQPSAPSQYKGLPTTGKASSADDELRRRNREHARNTRLRKKAYVTKLEQAVESMQADETMRVRLTKQSEAEERVRKAQMHDIAILFLRYHFGGELEQAKWSEIAVDGIRFSTPVAPFRSFNPSHVRKGSLNTTSVAQLIEASSSWTILFQTIGRGSHSWCEARKANLQLKFEVEVKGTDMLTAATSLFACFHLHTTNAIDCGSERECYLHGMLRISFTPPKTEREAQNGAVAMPPPTAGRGGGEVDEDEVAARAPPASNPLVGHSVDGTKPRVRFSEATLGAVSDAGMHEDAGERTGVDSAGTGEGRGTNVVRDVSADTGTEPSTDDMETAFSEMKGSGASGREVSARSSSIAGVKDGMSSRSGSSTVSSTSQEDTVVITNEHADSDMRILTVDIVYDVMAFMQQLHRASSKGYPLVVVPISIDTVEHDPAVPQIMFAVNDNLPLDSEQQTWPISNVNASWTAIFGFTNEEMAGQTLDTVYMSVDEPQHPNVQDICVQLRMGRSAAGMVKTQIKDREDQVYAHLVLFPIWDKESEVISSVLGAPCLLEHRVIDTAQAELTDEDPRVQGE